MKYRVLFFASLSAAALAGCGQKGPLYMPAKPPAVPAAETAPAAAAAPAEAAATITDTPQDKDNKKKDASSKPAAPAAQP